MQEFLGGIYLRMVRLPSFIECWSLRNLPMCGQPVKTFVSPHFVNTQCHQTLIFTIRLVKSGILIFIFVDSEIMFSCTC